MYKEYITETNKIHGNVIGKGREITNANLIKGKFEKKNRKKTTPISKGKKRRKWLPNRRVKKPYRLNNQVVNAASKM